VQHPGLSSASTSASKGGAQCARSARWICAGAISNGGPYRDPCHDYELERSEIVDAVRWYDAVIRYEQAA
jgi:hypothetical protein